MTQLSRRSRDHELRGSTSYSAWQRLALTRPSASRKTTLLRCGSRRSCRTTIRGSPRSSKIWVPLCAGTGPLITTARRYAPSEGAASSHLESGFGSLVQRVTRHMVRARVLEGILHPLWDLSRRVRRRNSHRQKTEIRAASGSALTGPRARRDRRGGRRPAGAQPWCSDAGGGQEADAALLGGALTVYGLLGDELLLCGAACPLTGVLVALRRAENHAVTPVAHG
jgi:hypothetical protein